ncbi:MAG: efflux RND transporter permease subunit [Melioribacteraceae bacterium]|nr:efflux RND transporter permease subunit [Melioribacteraceae bacterium]MCF8356804.1 efflux RND transporter permease subunit [Melioribacteraceae bacterium]MCF8394983.1 efflux RND transporter permease subunit [Melioribacteraceae bacterium]MCF8419703.1 efflux RND transporter permease subunit [Melioribacteraceae bacterium]
MILAKTSINRPIMTTMGIFVFLIFGILAYVNLNLDQMPDVEIPFVTVQTVYPGAGPKEIETLVTKRIEDAVSTISLIESVESYSLDGVSIVILEFDLTKDVDIANQEVKDKVDQILNELPDDAHDPIVEKVDIRAFPIIDVVLSGDTDPRSLFEIADKTLKDKFSQIQGVAKVDITGGQEREIRVILDNKEIYENYISLPQLMQTLAAHNMKMPGGYFQIKDQEYTVRLDGEFKDLEELRELQIPTPFGDKKLRQFAAVSDTGKDVRQRTIYFNAEKNSRDENVVRLGIIKSSDGNAVKVANAVREALPVIKTSLPENTNLEIVADRSTFIRATVDDTMSNIILGIIFTSIVLFIFLTDIRSTIIVALTMPTSIISTFLLLQAFGLTLNMMTLMGLSVSVGVLVANSVVVLENIFRHKSMGKDNKRSSYIGTTEVVVAVLAATMTNLVVFLPIASMTSIVGRFLRELALAASFATLFSLIFSFTLTPMLASLILPQKLSAGKISNKLNAVFKSWDELYRGILTKILKTKLRSWIVIGSAFSIFIAATIIYGPRIGFEFMPQLDDGKIKIEVELPEGFNLNETAVVLENIENIVKQHEEVVHMITNLGKISDLNTGANMARMDVQLVDEKEREISHSAMISQLIMDLSAVPNAKIAVDYGSSVGGGGAPVQFYFQGQDLDILEEWKEKIIEECKDVPGLVNFDNSSRAGKPEMTITPKREMIADAGLTVQMLALTLRSAVAGLESSKYRESGNEYDITITMKDQSVNTPEDIGNIPIVSSKGVIYKTSQIADINFTQGYTKILHRDKYTTIQFTGSSSPDVPLGNVTSEIEKRMNEMDFPPGYKFTWGGNVKMMNEMISDMLFAFILAIILTYMLLAAILESFLQPFFILLTIPLAMIGVFASLYHTGISFAITSLMAIIMLIGIVVNNAILMLDYTNQLVREEGMEIKEGLIEACPTKLKPILMSTIAIILGMLPMALGIGDAGKEMRMPLGVVSIGGLIVSTILTLFVIPAFYYVTAKKRSKPVEDKI